jgi:predicted amidophosphoribosyltransferase
MTVQAASSGQTPACLFCGRQLAWIERRCPAFALAGVAAHAGCCGGCTTRAEHERVSNSTVL